MGGGGVVVVMVAPRGQALSLPMLGLYLLVRVCASCNLLAQS